MHKMITMGAFALFAVACTEQATTPPGAAPAANSPGAAVAANAEVRLEIGRTI